MSHYLTDAHPVRFGHGKLENIEQNLDGVAEEALREQAHGDEFKPYTSIEVEKNVKRLNELDTEIAALNAKIYGSMKDWANGPYKGPPYLERERLSIQLATLEHECYQIKAYLREVALASGGITTEKGNTPYTHPEVRVIGGQ